SKPEPPKTEPSKEAGGKGTTTVVTQVESKTKGDTSSAAVSKKAMEDAIDSVLKESEKAGTKASVELKISAPKTAKTVEVSIPKQSMNAVATGKTESLVISSHVAEIQLNTKALTAITAAAGEDVKVSATIADREQVIAALPEEKREAAQAEIGDRPVFDFNITSGKTKITDFADGVATISVPYTLRPGEKPGGVYVMYVDDAGNLTKVGGKYDLLTKTITFDVAHFSLYAVGYDALSAWENPFTDVQTDAWYYEGVAFVSDKGLFAGTTATTFDPQMDMTRGMLWTVLHRMAGSPGKTDAPLWYADGQTWAMSEKISDGTNPTENVTREQLAAILFRYAKASAAASDLGKFTDGAQVSDFARDGVNWAVATGILKGDGAALNPLGTATRAEVAVMLQRLAAHT
ncbi:MAG: S-layer homology domain-containing protein, partial [Oscillospiraceae bacterium]